MGLNIGIEVRAPSDHGWPIAALVTPRGTAQELEDRLFAYLHARLPGAEETYGGGWASRDDRPSASITELPEVVFDFDVRVAGYGRHLEAAGYTLNDLYVAVFAFVMEEFPIERSEELCIRVYRS